MATMALMYVALIALILFAPEARMSGIVALDLAGVFATNVLYHTISALISTADVSTSLRFCCPPWLIISGLMSVAASPSTRLFRELCRLAQCPRPLRLQVYRWIPENHRL
jgi:hypothetical protein